MANELNTSIQYLGGVGPKRAELLRRELGIETLSDLIHLYPFRYIDRSGIVPIAQVAPDVAFVQIQATVVSRTLYGPQSAVVSQETNPIHWGAVKRLSVIVEDASGRIEIVFFKGIRWNYQRLAPGSTFLFFGKPQGFNGRMNIVHPEVDVPQDGAMAQGALTGVYPSTEKLKTGGITGKVMCKLQAAALSLCLPEIRETLPEGAVLDITIHEGRNRQVRRMFEEAGHKVLQLRRVRFGPLELGDLPRGQWRELTTEEVNALRRAAGMETV